MVPSMVKTLAQPRREEGASTGRGLTEHFLTSFLGFQTLNPESIFKFTVQMGRFSHISLA